MKRYFSLILAIAATVSAQIVPSTGNVRGPTSATDNAVARYDGTTGKLIQNSGVTIDDSGNLTVSGTGTSTFSGNLRLQNTAYFANTATVDATTKLTIDTIAQQGIDIFRSDANANYSAIRFRNSANNATNAQIGWNGTSLRLEGGPVEVVGNASVSGTLLSTDIITNSVNSGEQLLLERPVTGTFNPQQITFKQYDANSVSRSVAGVSSYKTGNTAGAVNGQLILVTANAGTMTAALTLNSSQALQLNAYGAGTLTTDSSGNVTATSDERAKNITGTFTKGLAEVVKLTPKRYTWKQETGLNTTDEVASLTAQDLIAAGIHEAVSTYRTVADLNDDGTPKLDADRKPLTKRIDATYTVSDRAVIAALVNAIKELNAKVAALEAARK